MMTTHSLTFISNSSSNKSDYLRTNGMSERMKWVSKKSDYLRTNGMSERKRTNEMSEQEERLFANEWNEWVNEMSEQEERLFARWVRNKSEWVGWHHLLTTNARLGEGADHSVSSNMVVKMGRLRRTALKKKLWRKHMSDNPTLCLPNCMQFYVLRMTVKLSKIYF